MPALLKCIKWVVDLAVTLLLWIYYIFGWLVTFLPFYFYAFLFSRNREEAFQRLNNVFHRSFFFFLRLITPGLKWRISRAISSIRGSVIVCNHLSYLDPILFVSLFARQKTIVKSDFFSYPVFGWVLKTSGFLPSMTGDEFTPILIEQVERMKNYLSSGGNLFVFPEAHRSRDGRIGPFNKGVFTIARRCQAPIRVLAIRNTDRLFPPDRFLFNTCIPNTVEVEWIGSLEPDGQRDASSLADVMAEVRFLMEKWRHEPSFGENQ
jgi:1-acyl-sn-glycerol-3-phosphate acyltransferase